MSRDARQTTSSISHQLDARAWVIWTLTAALLTTLTRNPLYVAIILLTVRLVGAVWQQTDTALMLPLWRLGLFIFAFSTLFNLLFVHVGETVLLRLPASWRLPSSRLTAFVGFRLHAVNMVAGDEPELAFTLKLPAQGLPDDRVHQILRVLIDSPERLLRFLRALLGGLDGLMDWDMAPDDDAEAGRPPWGRHPADSSDAAVLEDLVRAAARDPERLAPGRRLLADLCATAEGRRLVPDRLLELWQAVDAALGIALPVAAPIDVAGGAQP